MPSDTPSLFKSADPNTIGNTAQSVLPSQDVAVAPNGYGEPKTVVKFQPAARGGWRTINEELAQENDPLVLTASVSAFAVENGIFAGPITGIALFGSGSGATQSVEFDIPTATADEPGGSLTNILRGGIQISVPATSLEIRARNDQNLIPDPVGGIDNLAIGTSTGLSVHVTGSIGKGVKPTYSRTTKTVWLINRSALVAQFVTTNSGTIKVPPFATSVRVMRWSSVSAAAAQIDIRLVTAASGSATFIDSITVPVGTLCPDIILGGHVRNISVVNTDAVNSIQAIAAVFTLAI